MCKKFAHLHINLCIMESLLQKSGALVRQVSTHFHRYLFSEIRWENRLTGIKGARGTGKTTLLLQHLHALNLPATKAAYFSLDDIYFTQNLLSETIEQFYRAGGKYAYLDEVHKYPGWAREIKNLHDFYPELQIVFTGSSIIDLAREEGDLSRRALMYELHGLSYREYLELRGILDTPAIPLERLLNDSENLSRLFPVNFRPLEHFRDYLTSGYYPFFRDDLQGYPVRLAQLVRTVIEYDMAEIKGYDPRNARKLLQLLFILSNNVPYKPNLSQLAQKADIHRNTILNYLIYLEQARLIRLLQPEGFSISMLQKPEKIYLNNPNLSFALSVTEPNVGNLRETFFFSQLQHRHRVTAAAKGDFLIDDRFTFEIGGKQKSYAQIADITDSFVVRDELEYPIGKALPLWIFGLLY
jgi:predicted AAA+ superfamily ATPase